MPGTRKMYGTEHPTVCSFHQLYKGFHLQGSPPDCLPKIGCTDKVINLINESTIILA